MSTHALAFDANTPTLPTPEESVHSPQQRLALASSVMEFIATVSLEYGGFDARLFHILIDWLGPVAEELRIPATLVPNTLDDPNMPAHEVVVLEHGEDFWLFTAVQSFNGDQSVIICARPPFDGNFGKHVLLHASESIFKTSLSSPDSPFLPVVPLWIRQT